MSAFTISALSLLTIASGVPAGANIAYQFADSKPGYTESIVGTSGTTEERLIEVTASGLTWLLRT